MTELWVVPLLFFCAVVTLLDAGSGWLRRRRRRVEAARGHNPRDLPEGPENGA